MKNSLSWVQVLHNTLNLVISRCCFAEDDKEMYQNSKNARAERLFLLIKLFVLWRCRRRRRGVFVRSLIARGHVLIPVFHKVQLVN